MAGLLDVFSTPEGMQGLSLLSAAAPTMEPQNLASRIAMAGNTYRGMQQGLLRDKLLNAQIDNLGSEADARRASLAKTQALLDLFKPDASLPGASMATTQPGQLGSGSFGIVPPPAGSPAIPQSGAPSASRIGALTPDKLAQLKLLGVDLTDVYKLTQPDMQVSNGYAYDRRNLQPGFVPGMNTSQDGKVTLTLPGANGIPRVTAAPGSLETFGNFEDRKNASAAGVDLVKVVGPDGAERYVPKSRVLGSQPQPAAPAAGSTALVRPGDADRAAIYAKELADARARLSSAKSPEEINRATTDIAALQREMKAAGIPEQGGFQATPTTAQAAAKAAALKQAESNVRPAEQRQNEVAAGNYMLSVIDRALKHPGLSEATGLQGLFDPRNYIPGTDAKDFQVVHDQLVGNTFLQAYALLKGGGQITEVEGAKSQNAIARLNRAQSTEAYKDALNDLREVVTSAMTRSKNNMEAGGMSPNFAGDNSNLAPKANLVAELPKTAAKGTRARDTATGKVMVFNGLAWTPEK